MMAKSLKNLFLYSNPGSVCPEAQAGRIFDFKLKFSFQQVRVLFFETLLGDNIMPKILKFSAQSVAVHLTKLLNLCISNSTWPTEWKLSHVTPIFKKDDTTSVSNYRSFSVLSIIPKIVEKVMFDQLYDVFQPLFSSNMSGLLRGHSCCTTLVKMVDDWCLALDSKKVTGSIAIDVSKAFDSICHNCFLQSYVLMALVRRQLTSCIPTCLVESKE